MFAKINRCFVKMFAFRICQIPLHIWRSTYIQDKEKFPAVCSAQGPKRRNLAFAKVNSITFVSQNRLKGISLKLQQGRRVSRSFCRKSFPLIGIFEQVVKDYSTALKQQIPQNSCLQVYDSMLCDNFNFDNSTNKLTTVYVGQIQRAGKDKFRCGLL